MIKPASRRQRKFELKNPQLQQSLPVEPGRQSKARQLNSLGLFIGRLILGNWEKVEIGCQRIYTPAPAHTHAHTHTLAHTQSVDITEEGAGGGGGADKVRHVSWHLYCLVKFNKYLAANLPNLQRKISRLPIQFLLF